MHHYSDKQHFLLLNLNKIVNFGGMAKLGKSQVIAGYKQDKKKAKDRQKPGKSRGNFIQIFDFRMKIENQIFFRQRPRK